ncbi:formylglycine-generating enzyme family protein [Streptomyces sp. NPDC059597]|uniref:formylglycine-generating enzyme family protein n=1 Tax=Streptomyces sp. NPDC059597 TaxID=3346879 RepID=UPI00367C5533
MVAVPSGRVVLSDRRTRRSWPVEVAPFLMSAVPVTQGWYAELIGGRPSSVRGERLPVEGVSWWDAVRFCNALSRREGLRPAYRLPETGTEAADPAAPDWDTTADGYRLPTEAEWEHACRADTTGPRYGPLGEVAWYQGNSGGRPHPVGGKRPNTWGLHDMLGNVWDWCWDVYDPEVYGTYRVLRGGGWADEHWSCRASVRRRGHPTFRIDDVGFRVARSAPHPTLGRGGLIPQTDSIDVTS